MTDARKYLSSFKSTEEKIELKIKQVQALRERLSCVSAPMDKEQVSHTTNVSIMADTVAMIVDLQKEIDQQSSALVASKKEAFALLDQIHSENASILINRFFVGMSIEEICKENHISIRNAYRRQQDALTEFQAVLNRLPQKLA